MTTENHETGVAGTRPRGGVLGAHWRGELPLRLSFWGSYAAVSAAAGLVLGTLATWMAVTGRHLQGGSLAMLVGWPLMLLLLVWGAVGVWRSSSRYAAGKGTLARWALGAKLAACLGLLVALLSTLLSFAPMSGEYVDLARGVDPVGHVEASVSADGQRLKLHGPLGLGDAARVQGLLAGAPGIGLLELDSSGGRMGEGLGIAEAVRGRPALQVRATGACDGPCALVFLAANHRQVLPQARLGFHRASDGSFNPLFKWLADGLQVRLYSQAGLPDAFIDRVLSVASTRWWHPELDELVASGLVRMPARPLDVDLPPAGVPASLQAHDFAEALSTNATWQTLDKRFPGTIDVAAGRMLAARQAGAADEATLIEGQRVVEELLPRLLVDASPEVRIQFMALLSEQLEAIRGQGAESCRALIIGDAAVRHGLPVPIAKHEATWLSDASTESLNPARRGKLTPIELEVVRRSLGDGAPVRLSAFWRPGKAEAAKNGNGNGDCDKAAALIADVMRLPLAERRLAVRLIFGQDDNKQEMVALNQAAAAPAERKPRGR